MTGGVFRLGKGVVYLVLENGQQCYFEPLGSYDIELDDIVTGDLWSLGEEEHFNATKSYPMRVFMEGHT